MLPDIPFANLTLGETLARMDRLVQEGGPARYLCFCDSNLCTAAARDPELAAILRGADAVLADGVSVLLLARLRGAAIRERVRGPAVLAAATAAGATPGLRHFFYGGGPGVAQALAARLRAANPLIQIAGTHTPPQAELPDARADGFLEKLHAAKADVLWVGLGAPKQEHWMGRNAPLLQVPVVLGVGAAFDFLAGTRRWAPPWVRRIGMEWAFRAVTGGRHTFLRNLRCVSRMTLLLARAGAERVRTGSKP